jgi:8-oxo-dGTP diphosphatase
MDLEIKINVSIPEADIRSQAAKDGITHLSTGVVILVDNKILMVRRAKGDFLAGNFELPGGGVDDGETITEGAIREIKEETGLNISKIITMFNGFDYSTDKKPKARQINFIAEVKPGKVILDPKEHDAYMWVSENAVDGIKMSENMRRCVVDALRICH